MNWVAPSLRHRRTPRAPAIGVYGPSIYGHPYKLSRTKSKDLISNDN